MKKIMFVCHGNICRSPMAKYIFKSLTNEYQIESRATSTEEIGNDIYPPIKKVLDNHNIFYDRHYAKQITKSEFNEYDYIFVFDYNNLRNITRMFGESNKVSLLSDNEIDDPWYTRDFETCYSDILRGILNIIKEIKED
jgi:protein-tyrosine phosphatase